MKKNKQPEMTATEKLALHGKIRQAMRRKSLKYRRFTAPGSFDGTLKTYRSNLLKASLCLEIAIGLRQQSQQLCLSTDKK